MDSGERRGLGPEAPYHATLQKAHDDLARKHRELASTLIEKAETAREGGAVKDAIRFCLKIRDKSYLAEGKAAEAAKKILGAYRGDREISRKYRSLLKGSENWK